MKLRLRAVEKIAKWAFVWYIIALAAITIMPRNLPLTIDFHATRVNFVPFEFIGVSFEVLGAVRASEIPISLQGIIMLFLDRANSFFLNIILFMPLGFLLPFFTKRKLMRNVIFVGFLISLTIEIIQFLTMAAQMVYNRVSDVNDLIANTLGALIGFLLYIYAMKIIKK